MTKPQEQASPDWMRDTIANVVHNLPYDNELANATLLSLLALELVEHAQLLRLAHHRRNAESLT